MSSCPLSYRLGAARFRRCPTVSAHTVFTVGGLYGNQHALSAVLERAAREQAPSLVVFNGDFNFFNTEPGWWSDINNIIRHGGMNGGTVRLLATQGNVEVEASAVTPQGGCGCDYPSYVSAGVVSRSDAIVERLRAAAHHPSADASILSWLRSLPPALSVDITPHANAGASADTNADAKAYARAYASTDDATAGANAGAEAGANAGTTAGAKADAPGPREASSARIAILHGDPDSLSGWGLSSEAVDADASVPPLDGGAEGGALAARVARAEHSVQQAMLRRQLNFDTASHERTGRDRLLRWFGALGVQAILSTHSCLAFAQDLRPTEAEALAHGSTVGRPLTVFNNGSAGMPNFIGERCGVMTRVSGSAGAPPDSMYGAQLGSLRIDAVPVAYDHEAWRRTFREAWPEGSAANVSYARRIERGPEYTREMAVRLACG